MYTVIVDYDDCPDSPCMWEPWRVVSFGRNHDNFQHPGGFFRRANRAGDPQPLQIGLRRQLRCGTAFILSCYEHSGRCWSLRREGPQCLWDSVDVAGLLICTDIEQLPVSYEGRSQRAREFLRVYNAWVNGEVYGFVVIDDATGKIVHSCWGYYELEHMVGELTEYLPSGEEMEWYGPLSGHCLHLLGELQGA